ncbi:MAG: HXXEE domain-containing protein [Spirochaetia bacterium]|nr:HXXEE domain-containing protein [Spirochaetia bacterium]
MKQPFDLPDARMRKAIHALPWAFALHNLEETVGMEAWTHKIPSFVHAPVSTLQFAFAVAIFTILGFGVVYFRRPYPNQDSFFKVVSGFAGMLLLNVLFPHLLATILLRQYAPGVVTGLLLNLPLTLFILIRGIRLGWISVRGAVLASLCGGVVGAFLAAALLQVGRLIMPY